MSKSEEIGDLASHAVNEAIDAIGRVADLVCCGMHELPFSVQVMVALNMAMSERVLELADAVASGEGLPPGAPTAPPRLRALAEASPKVRTLGVMKLLTGSQMFVQHDVESFDAASDAAANEIATTLKKVLGAIVILNRAEGEARP